MSTNADTGSASYLPNGKAYELLTWYTDGERRPVSLASAMITKVKGQGCNVRWCVCQVLAGKSRTKRPRNTKISRKVAHLMSNNAHQFQGQRSKVKVTRPINAEIKSVSYLQKRKAYELQTSYTDETRRPVSPTRSKVKVARSRGPTDSCLPISRERKVPETPKLAGNLLISRAIMRTKLKVKRSRSPGWLMLKPKVCRLRTLGRRLEHLLSTAMANRKVLWSYNFTGPIGYCTRAGAYRGCRTRPPHNLLFLFGQLQVWFPPWCRVQNV